MQFCPLLVLGILLLLARGCLAGGMDRLRSVEDDLKRYERETKETQMELASTIKKQHGNPTPAEAGELEKKRNELEAVASTLIVVKREATERRREMLARLDSRKPCPVCGGKLAKIKNVARNEHYRNPDVWPKVLCTEYNYVADSPICTRCWAAQNFATGTWMQISNDPKAFVAPLTPALAKVPLPPLEGSDAKWTFRRHQEANGKRHEQMWLSLKESPAGYVSSLEKYAQEHGLEFDDDELTLGPRRQITVSTPDEGGDAPPPLPY